MFKYVINKIAILLLSTACSKVKVSSMDGQRGAANGHKDLKKQEREVVSQITRDLSKLQCTSYPYQSNSCRTVSTSTCITLEVDEELVTRYDCMHGKQCRHVLKTSQGKFYECDATCPGACIELDSESAVKKFIEHFPKQLAYCNGTIYITNQ